MLRPEDPAAVPGSRDRLLRLIGALSVPGLAVAFVGAFAIATRNVSFEGRVFPLSAGILVLIVSLTILSGELRAFRAARAASARRVPARESGEGARPAGAAAFDAAGAWQRIRGGFFAAVLTALLVPLAGRLGFFVVLPAYLLALLLLLGVRPRWLAVVTSALYTGITWLVFGQLMGLRLPTGG